MKNLIFTVIFSLIALSCGDREAILERRNKARTGKSDRPLVSPIKKRDSVTVSYEVKIKELEKENQNLKAQLMEINVSDIERKRNPNVEMCTYQNMVDLVLTRKSILEQEEEGKPSHYYSQWYHDLHDLEYTKSVISGKIDKLIEGQISYLAKTVKFNYKAIAENDTSKTWVYLDKKRD